MYRPSALKLIIGLVVGLSLAPSTQAQIVDGTVTFTTEFTTNSNVSTFPFQYNAMYFSDGTSFQLPFSYDVSAIVPSNNGSLSVSATTSPVIIGSSPKPIDPPTASIYFGPDGATPIAINMQQYLITTVGTWTGVFELWATPQNGTGYNWEYTEFGYNVNSYAEGSYALSISSVPEPETYRILLAGLGLIGLMASRKKFV
ncbi:hypothetical protein AAKU67_001903 [Oxalobacteraceae bacterium GrIS 2.11]